jgi:hypothetical protein
MLTPLAPLRSLYHLEDGIVERPTEIVVRNFRKDEHHTNRKDACKQAGAKAL